MTGMDEKPETLAQELSRLVGEYLDEDAGDATRAEALNMIADFVVENSKAVVAALSALPAAPMPGVKATVKPLEWTGPNMSMWVSEPLPGFQYRIIYDGRGHDAFSWFVGGTWTPVSSLEAAKAAAQADYTQRVLSALDVPAHPEGVKAWQDIPVDDTTINYVMRFGGRCRECADHEGVCPGGLPCDIEEAKATIRHVLRAVNYGMGHGFLPALSNPEPVAQEAVAQADRDLLALRAVMPVHPSPSPEQGEDARESAETEISTLRARVAELDRLLNEEQMQTANGGEIITELRARVAELEARATPQAGASEAEPLAYASAGQIGSFEDRPGDEGGVYIPLRKTPIGNFQMPLYATPPDSDAVRALRASLVAMKLASAMPGVAAEYDFGPAIDEVTAALSGKGSSSK